MCVFVYGGLCLQGMAKSSSGNNESTFESRVGLYLGECHCFSGKVFLTLFPFPLVYYQNTLKGSDLAGWIWHCSDSLSKGPEDTKFYPISFTELLGNGMVLLITCFQGVRSKIPKLTVPVLGCRWKLRALPLQNKVVRLTALLIGLFSIRDKRIQIVIKLKAHSTLWLTFISQKLFLSHSSILVSKFGWPSKNDTPRSCFWNCLESSGMECSSSPQPHCLSYPNLPCYQGWHNLRVMMS